LVFWPPREQRLLVGIPAPDAALMKARIGIGAAALLAAGALGWMGLHRAAPEPGPVAANAQVAADGGISLNAAQLEAQGVETATVEAAAQLPVTGLPAQAAAPLSASAQVVAPYGGVVTRILVDEGAPVRRGQALARIQSREVLAAQAELARARVEADAAALQARRDAALLAEGIIPAARNEQSQARAAAAQSALRQASGALSLLRPVADAQAGEYELLAPMTGQLVRRLLTPGQAVAALDAAFVVAEPGLIDVNFSAPLRLRSALVPGLAVRLPDGALARVAAVGADADASSQSLRVRARIEPTQGGTLSTPGQQFSVSLLLPAPAGALAVPPSALLPAAQDQVLYVAEKAQESMRIRAVAVRWLGGDETSSVVQTIQPEDAPRLQPGAQVVTRGTALLKAMIPAQ
jgi:RND family efflux transporter MFP subunit